MKNLIQYVYSCTKAFFEFTNDGEDLDILHHQLMKVQKHAKSSEIEPKGKELWFKFSDDDTGATSILELLNDLSGANGKSNQNLRYEQITECNTLDVKTELRVFYS